MAMQKIADASSLRTSRAQSRDSARATAAPGFRHFLGTPNPSQRFRAFGIDPLNRPNICRTPRTDAPPVAANGCRNTLAAASQMDRRSTGKTPRSLRVTPICCNLSRMIWFIRRSRFRLREAWRRHSQCAPRAAPARNPVRQRSGRLAASLCAGCAERRPPHQAAARAHALEGERTPSTGCPFRDIARARAENVTGIDRSIAGIRVALTEALVADPRNDDHAIMSQLTALFALLHNGLIDLIRRGEPASRAERPVSAPPTSDSCARRDALTPIYHNIHPQGSDAAGDASGDLRGLLRPDPALHRSARCIRPGASRSELADSVRILARRVSLRSRHGAARIRASTISPPTISTTRWKRLPRTIPSTCRSIETWMVRWSRFFEINGSQAEFQPAHRTVSQRRAGQRPDLSGVRRRPNASACSIATCSARRSPECGRWMR